MSYVCDKRVNQVEESEKHEDQGVETVPLAPTEMAMEDDTVNEKGPTDNERKIICKQSVWSNDVKDIFRTLIRTG